ncbi:hypothetical protein [Pandoraea horticolens]|nr:hypothetical protein [Pandoraea horticolens]
MSDSAAISVDIIANENENSYHLNDFFTPERISEFRRGMRRR